MPYSSCNSIYSTDTIPIPAQPYYNHQAHSLISQDPHVIAFCTASPTKLPMTDHHNNNDNHSIDIRALDARLARVEQFQRQQEDQVSFNDTTTTSINGDIQRRPRPPLDTTINTTHLTRPFTKSSTMSTTSTAATTTSSFSSPAATTRLHPETVGVAPGTFSKPRVPRRSRRRSSSDTSSSAANSGMRRARSEEQQQQTEFRYYGRHGNQWLFNDFSVTGAVARGVRRVFGHRQGDWYDDRK